jgi:hypothetical protein
LAFARRKGKGRNLHDTEGTHECDRSQKEANSPTKFAGLAPVCVGVRRGGRAPRHGAKRDAIDRTSTSFPAVHLHQVADSAQDGFDPFSFECSAINNRGDIAFEESVDSGGSGIFVTEGSGFKTIAEPDSNVIVGRPNLNDAGTVAFHRFFNDRAGEELVSGNGGPLTVIADTSGPFQSFGFYFGFTPPALNDNGDVAFLAELDSSGGTGIFVGPDPVGDRVIGTGDTLDGSSVTNLRFCDEGLNDSGQLAFQATFDDPNVPDGRRVAIYRATPVP